MGLSQGDGDPDDSNLAKNEADSDSELEHFGAKEKGSRAKFNRVSRQTNPYINQVFFAVKWNNN